MSRMLGKVCPGDGDVFTFPNPEQLAAVSDNEMKKASLGFRTRYVAEFARRVVGGGWAGR